MCMPEHLDPERMQEVKNSEDTWVVDFWAEWCGPCKKLAPRYEEVSEEIEDVKFGKVDMEEHQDIGTSEGVRALPTLVIYRNGEEVARQSGAMSKSDLKDWIKENA